MQADVSLSTEEHAEATATSSGAKTAGITLSPQIQPLRDAILSDEDLINRRLTALEAGFSTATLDREIRAGRFPRPVRISSNRVAWRVGDIREWKRNLDTREWKQKLPTIK